LFATSTSIYAQGNTTSSINGVIYDTQGEPLPGASLLVTHFAFKEHATLRRLTLLEILEFPNMRVGGPKYKV
jgi:hypothetical protein